jgi:hypothetical protein
VKFGPVPPKKIPKQDPEKVLLLAERWQRAAWAQQRWAERAKKAVDFFEGRQWTETQLAELKRQKRPALKFNIIAPLVRLVLGYQRSNKNDIVFQPGQDARSAEDVAEALTKIEKAIAANGNMEFVDCEVFLDGLIASRGFFDTRLNFDDNDLGEVRTIAADPFSVYIDPDAWSYDLSESASFVQQALMVSLEEIEAAYGKKTSQLLKPFVLGQTPLAPISTGVIDDEISPIRTFGEREDMKEDWWDTFYSMVGDFVDTRRRTIRVIETQYKVREPKNVIIDLETGDKKVLPDDWGQDKIAKALFYANEIVRQPCYVQRRVVERVHWTVMAGDLILYDAPSLYDGYTLSGYFPYFRRGMTIGMVDDLIDPQMEKNKRRSARVEMVSKSANGGWKYHESSLDPAQERNLKNFGSAPGVNIKWKGEHSPEQIQPTNPPMAQQRLEIDADDDIKKISGINEAALGSTEPVQSGRALEAKQRQAVLSIQMYMDNFKRTKMMVGKQHLSIIQQHYTEPRMYRILGDDGKFTQVFINQEQVNPFDGGRRIINDVTVGKYTAIVDDAPLSATFMDAQFQEMLTILEKIGPAIGNYIPAFGDLIIDMSSMPRKEEWKKRIQAVMGAMGMNFGPLPGDGPPQQPQLQPPGGGGGSPPPGPQGGPPVQPGPQGPPDPQGLPHGAPGSAQVIPFTQVPAR